MNVHLVDTLFHVYRIVFTTMVDPKEYKITFPPMQVELHGTSILFPLQVVMHKYSSL